MELCCPACNVPREGKFCPECGTALVAASFDSGTADPGKSISGPSFGDVGYFKGSINTEDNSQHIHYHGVTPKDLVGKVQTCATCGKSLNDQWFLCRDCDKKCCLDCRDQSTGVCRECLVELASQGRKQVAKGFENQRYLASKLSIQVPYQGQMRNICLVANDQITFGRRRTKNDVVLRLWPDSAENQELTNKISRTHGQIVFRPTGVWWANEPPPSCVEGSRVNGKQLNAGEKTQVRPGTTISPANSLEMVCSTFPADPTLGDSAYSEFAAEMGDANSVGNDCPVRSVRLLRDDLLAGKEEYIAFSRGIKIGNSPGCEIRLPESSIAPVHARIVHLAGCFWIEACQSHYPIGLGASHFLPNRLLPLLPDRVVKIGEVELAISTFQQYILDLPI